MSIWNAYPSDYRTQEVHAIVAATRSGECVSVMGLSGAGKSNLLGFIAHTQATPAHACILIDLNRLPTPAPPASPDALLGQIGRALGESSATGPTLTLETLSALIEKRLTGPESSLTLLLDRFDTLADSLALAGNLRALRDAHKYQLTLVTATRRALPPHTEFSELFYANRLWLGVLSESDARWNVRRYAARRGLVWEKAIEDQLLTVSAGYPSFLRAACEAHAAGASLELASLAAHPAVQARVEEFLADQPTEAELQLAGLAHAPLLKTVLALTAAPTAPAASLTAKEARLLSYFQTHPHIICEKDDLIRAVWPEDKVFERGVRDDSLAQLVRRLREKIEVEAAQPRHICTAAGRGYRYEP